jgi:hypothetical protein
MGGKFSKEERIMTEKSDTGIGPASYHPNKEVSGRSEPRAVIGHEKLESCKNKNTPGPATYNLPKSEVFLHKEGIAE